MDIAKFNQELAEKVKKAQTCEKTNKMIEAIDLWVSIADLVLKVSKSPNLPFSYKSMLVKKSEQIVTHIKMLKSELIEKRPKIVEPVEEAKFFSQDITQEKTVEKKVIPSKPKPIEKDEEDKNIPEGFQEIEASKDFKIITPHDEAFLDKLLNMDSHDNTDETSQVPSRNEGKSFCFACGAEISPNLRVCPQCGTKLE